jgi:hypothetical protein|tara:strand:- start:1083 stop:1307 length:225 start_codon:yes stop_codon:yes gene_type:complete
MEKQKNIWKYYDDWKVHVTKVELFESICQTFNLMGQLDSCTKYYNGDMQNPIAWDIIVPDEFINDVKKYIKDFV